MKPNSYAQGEINLKNFRKGSRIDGGSFGTVYKIEEESTRNVYAAKVINCGDNEDQCKNIIEREVKRYLANILRLLNLLDIQKKIF